MFSSESTVGLVCFFLSHLTNQPSDNQPSSSVWSSPGVNIDLDNLAVFKPKSSASAAPTMNELSVSSRGSSSSPSHLLPSSKPNYNVDTSGLASPMASMNLSSSPSGMGMHQARGMGMGVAPGMGMRPMGIPVGMGMPPAMGVGPGMGMRPMGPGYGRGGYGGGMMPMYGSYGMGNPQYMGTGQMYSRPS